MHAVTIRIRGENELLGLLFKTKEAALAVHTKIKSAMTSGDNAVDITTDFTQHYMLRVSEIIHCIYRDQEAEEGLAELLADQEKKRQRKAALRNVQ